MFMDVMLLGSPTSLDVARVLTCLFEKNVTFDLVQRKSFSGTHLLDFQMRGEALTFKDGGTIITKPREIMSHIAAKYKDKGNPDLFGPGSLERSSIELWLQEEQLRRFDLPSASMVTSVAYTPLNMPLDGTGAGGDLQEARTRTDPSHRQKEEEQLTDLGKLLDTYEQRLGQQDYLAGSKFMLADLFHLPNADLLAAHPRTAHLIESRRNVKRWWDTISRRDSWSMVKELQHAASKDKQGAVLII